MEQFSLGDLMDGETENYNTNVITETGEVVEETALVEKPKRKMKPRGPSVRYYNTFDETGYGAFLRQVAQIGLSVKSRDPEDMKEGLRQYLKLCEEQNRRVTNLACYAAMGINRQIAYYIEHGKSGTPEQRRLISFVKGLCATYREAMILSGDLNPIVGIFWQKAYDGLNEMEEVNVFGSEFSDSEPDEGADEIAEKYSDLPED